jgi:hypothetical protein
MNSLIEANTRVRTTLIAAALVAATVPTAFADGPKITQTEVHLEPAGRSPTAHDQFGLATAISANGHTLAIGAPTSDEGEISEVGAVLIFDRARTTGCRQRGFSRPTATKTKPLFNVAISEDGNTVVATLSHDAVSRNQGVVYVFQRRRCGPASAGQQRPIPRRERRTFTA